MESTSTTTREFTLQFLKQITDNFSEEHIIGRGGYGIVYKGELDYGENIALKKLHHVPSLDDTQFRNEFNNLMMAQHQNIVRLVGYCYDVGHERIKLNEEYIFALVEERILCFEYLQGGSLDKYISDESCGLDWHTRYKIINGVCEGLNYLHNGCKDPIYHLDLKPANILLDKDMMPKIGDFGLSRLFPSTRTYITIKVIGTPGYMPPEYVERYMITQKYDVFSLGVIIIQIMAGNEAYSKCARLSANEFIEQVHENWRKRVGATMSPRTSLEVRTCMKLALRCVDADRVKRPNVAEIISELKEIDIAQGSLISQVPIFQSNEAPNQELEPSSRIRTGRESRGSIAFFTTNRPLVPVDIFSCHVPPSSAHDEVDVTDGVSYNYNCRSIPSAALKALLKRPIVAAECDASDADIDAGRASGLVFVSERRDGCETLHVALRLDTDTDNKVKVKVKVLALADIFGGTSFSGTRLEDSGCFGGGYSMGSRTVDHSLIYVSTKEPLEKGHRASTAVYKTNLRTGTTERLTPIGEFDLSPAVSPSGKKVAVASFRPEGWADEMEDLQTDIRVMNVEKPPLQRKRVIKNGGWPTWGSDNIIFFHRKVGKTWGVFRFDITTAETVRVTPEAFDAMTPAAISETKVAVATVRQTKSRFGDWNCRVEAQHRHIEIFDMMASLEQPPLQITQKTRPKCDHYNPFVLDGGARIGYHRCRSVDLLRQQGRQGDEEDVSHNLQVLESPIEDVGLFRLSLSGVSLTISKDGSKLAFIDDKTAVWVADSEGLRLVYVTHGMGSVFSVTWNQNTDSDMLYLCVGPCFDDDDDNPLEIYSMSNVSAADATHREIKRLTDGGFNNAFPSSSPDGDEFVFRSTRRGGDQNHKHLYIMDTYDGELGEGTALQLTNGQWTDTHCQWSPNRDWIVFSSSRDKSQFFSEVRDDMDPGFFAVYVVNSRDAAVVRVIGSGDKLGGQVNYPVFSPDGRSIAVTGDFAAVSAEPISLPMFRQAAVRSYRDIFVVDIDPDDMKKNQDSKVLRRITHSRYECSTPTWTTALSTDHTNAQWNMLVKMVTDDMLTVRDPNRTYHEQTLRSASLYIPPFRVIR